MTRNSFSPLIKVISSLVLPDKGSVSDTLYMSRFTAVPLLHSDRMLVVMEDLTTKNGVLNQLCAFSVGAPVSEFSNIVKSWASSPISSVFAQAVGRLGPCQPDHGQAVSFLSKGTLGPLKLDKNTFMSLMWLELGWRATRYRVEIQAGPSVLAARAGYPRRLAPLDPVLVKSLAGNLSSVYSRQGILASELSVVNLVMADLVRATLNSQTVPGLLNLFALRIEV